MPLKNALREVKVAVDSKYLDLKHILEKNNNPSSSKLYLRSRRLEQLALGRRYSFVSLDLLTYWTTEWVKTFPVTFDLIVGIPRSGLLVANIIACKLGKSLTTPEGFVQNQVWKSKKISESKISRVLLVDDTIDSGKSMDEAYKLLLSHDSNIAITKAALIATPHATKHIDLYFKVLSQPRLFEWNMLHSKMGPSLDFPTL